MSGDNGIAAVAKDSSFPHVVGYRKFLDVIDPDWMADCLSDDGNKTHTPRPRRSSFFVFLVSFVRLCAKRKDRFHFARASRDTHTRIAMYAA